MWAVSLGDLKLRKKIKNVSLLEYIIGGVGFISDHKKRGRAEEVI